VNLEDHFLRSDAAPLLLLAPIAAILLWGLDRARRQNLARMTGPRAAALAGELSLRRRLVRRVLGIAGLTLALVAILEPVWGVSMEAADRGVDVVVCLDVSRSMLARDADPSRLLAARREIRALADRARGDRLGLVVYAGRAQLVVPLTRDRASFAQLLDLADPEMVATGGTDPGAGLDLALQALTDASGESESIILCTDGDDPDRHGLAAAQRLRLRHIAVHCVGFGSMRGAKIPVERDGGETFLRDRAGNEVVSAMDAASLRAIADTTGGAFVEAARESHPLVSLYEDHIVPMAKKQLPDERRRERDSRFQWALVPAILLFMADLGLSDRRRR
jgi:Ca-activated chloride channel family protein